MSTITAAETFRLADHTVNRMGYGAMQLAGPGVFGPPADRSAAGGGVLPDADRDGVDGRVLHRIGSAPRRDAVHDAVLLRRFG